MSLLEKERAFLLSESCGSDCYDYEYDDEYDDDDLEDELDDIEELDENLNFTTEMVNIFAKDSYDGTKYLVELDSVSKLMETGMYYSEREAMEAIAEHNDISFDDMYLLIESDEAILEKMEEIAAKGGSMLKKAKENNAIKKLKDLKKDGIKLMKKKSKKIKNKFKRKSKK